MVDLEKLLYEVLQEDGLSTYTVSTIRLSIQRTCALGVTLGSWDATIKLAANIGVPLSDTDAANYVQFQRVSEDRIPTEAEVKRLLDVAWKPALLRWFILELAARSALEVECLWSLSGRN